MCRVWTAVRLCRLDAGSFTLARRIYWKNAYAVRQPKVADKFSSTALCSSALKFSLSSPGILVSALTVMRDLKNKGCPLRDHRVLRCTNLSCHYLQMIFDTASDVIRKHLPWSSVDGLFLGVISAVRQSDSLPVSVFSDSPCPFSREGAVNKQSWFPLWSTVPVEVARFTWCGLV